MKLKEAEAKRRKDLPEKVLQKQEAKKVEINYRSIPARKSP